VTDPLALLGLLALGSLIPIALFGGVAAYLFRGHKFDATGLRIISTHSVTVNHEPGITHLSDLLAIGRPGVEAKPKEPDLYDLAHGRGEDDQR
jgi:hypothetical protein